MSRKHPHADRDLRLTNLEGKPVTVNFNFVALREPSAVFPHTFNALIDVARRKNIRLEGREDSGEWYITKETTDGNRHLGFNRRSLSGTILTVATGSQSRRLEVVQSPEEIERALRKSSHDLHASGLQKWVAFETNEKRGLGATIRKLER